MEKEEVIDFLQNKIDELKENEPTAFNTINAYEAVITILLNE